LSRLSGNGLQAGGEKTPPQIAYFEKSAAKRLLQKQQRREGYDGFEVCLSHARENGRVQIEVYQLKPTLKILVTLIA
jgi:hypothetical protein